MMAHSTWVQSIRCRRSGQPYRSLVRRLLRTARIEQERIVWPLSRPAPLVLVVQPGIRVSDARADRWRRVREPPVPETPMPALPSLVSPPTADARPKVPSVSAAPPNRPPDVPLLSVPSTHAPFPAATRHSVVKASRAERGPCRVVWDFLDHTCPLHFCAGRAWRGIQDIQHRTGDGVSIGTRRQNDLRVCDGTPVPRSAGIAAKRPGRPCQGGRKSDRSRVR